MDFMWLVLGAVFVAVICTAYKIIKSLPHPPFGSVTRLSGLPFCPNDVDYQPAIEKLNIRWISMKECQTLVRNSDDVIFVFMSKTDKGKRYTFPEMSLVAVPPNELRDVLPWLTSGSSVVLCGEVHLCSYILASLDGIRGSAVTYGLNITDGCSQ